MTRPWRRITLQLSQILLTLGLTFMFFLLPGVPAVECGLLVAINDPTATEIVGRELYDDAIFRKDLDVVLAHLA